MKRISVLLLSVLLLGSLVGCGGEKEPNLSAGVVELAEKSYEEVKNPDNIIGVSDKNFLEVTKHKPTDVREATNDKWKKSTISGNVKIEEYAISYKNLYMEDGAVHYIINFNYHTTTQLFFSGELIFADITEYQEKEEHNARTIGRGILLAKYIIYPDGDIEEIDL